jgi:hypothetical protein
MQFGANCVIASAVTISSCNICISMHWNKQIMPLYLMVMYLAFEVSFMFRMIKYYDIQQME